MDLSVLQSVRPSVSHHTSLQICKICICDVISLLTSLSTKVLLIFDFKESYWKSFSENQWKPVHLKFLKCRNLRNCHSLFQHRFIFYWGFGIWTSAIKQYVYCMYLCIDLGSMVFYLHVPIEIWTKFFMNPNICVRRLDLTQMLLFVYSI